MVYLTFRQVLTVYACLNQAAGSLSALVSDNSLNGIRAFYEGKRITSLRSIGNEVNEELGPNSILNPFTSKRKIERELDTPILWLPMRVSTQFHRFFYHRHSFSRDEIYYMVHCIALMDRFLTTATTLNFHLIRRIRIGCSRCTTIFRIRCGNLKEFGKANRVEWYLMPQTYKHYTLEEILAGVKAEKQ